MCCAAGRWEEHPLCVFARFQLKWKKSTRPGCSKGHMYTNGKEQSLFSSGSIWNNYLPSIVSALSRPVTSAFIASDFASVNVMCECSRLFLHPTRLCSALVCLVSSSAGAADFCCSGITAKHFSSLTKGRKAPTEQVSHTGRCNGERTDNRPPGLTLLRRKNPSHQYGGQRSGKLCPLKHARWENDVTPKTCNPNENQIQSARSSEDLCHRKPPAQLQLPRSR